MQYVQFVAAQADTGAVIPYARFSVFLTGTLTLAVVYAQDGVTTIANPGKASITGAIGFAAANGAYDCVISSADGSYSLPPIINMQLYDLSQLDAQVNLAKSAAISTAADRVATGASATASAGSAAGSAASALIKNVLSAATSAGAALPFEVTAISGGIGTGTGGTPGTYAGGVSGGPQGFQWQYTIDSTGKLASYQILNIGLATTNAAPTLSLPSGGLVSPTVPTATVGAIAVNRMFYAPSSDGTQLLAWGNNAGTLASAPFAGTQLAVPLSTYIANTITGLQTKISTLQSLISSAPPKNYLGAGSLGIPLISIAGKQALGLDRTFRELLFKGLPFPVPSSGPLRDVASSRRTYTLSDKIILQSVNGRECLSYDVPTGKPLWLGQPFPVSAAASGGTIAPQISATDRPSLADPTALHGVFFYGQSLAVGTDLAGASVITTTQPYVNEMLNGGLVNDTPPYTSLVPLIETLVYNNGTPVLGESGMASAANYATTLAMAAGDIQTPGGFTQICALPGLGGQPISALIKGTAPYANFLAHVQAMYDLRAGRPFSVDTICWIQGEQDAQIGTTRAGYLAPLLQVRSDLDTDIKAITGQANTVRFLMYQTSHNITSSGGAIALAQMDAVKQSPFFHFATPVWPFPRSDYVHLTSAPGYPWFGKYLGRANYQVIAKGRVPDCCRPVSAFVVNGGTALTVRFLTPKWPLLIDTNIGSVAQYGIRVLDGTGDVAVSNVTATNDTLTMTLARAIDPTTAKFRLGLDAPGTDNGRATHNIRDSTATTVTISGTSYPLYHVSGADELAIYSLEQSA